MRPSDTSSGKLRSSPAADAAGAGATQVTDRTSSDALRHARAGRVSHPATSCEPQTLHFVVRRRKAVNVLIGVIASLILLSLAGQIAKFYFGRPHVFGLVRLFYVDVENNLPTWYQSLALGFAAVLLGAIGMAARRALSPLAGYWLALSLLFVFLSLDEAASIHEASMEPLRRLTGRLEGAWQPGWVILGIAAAAIVSAAFLRFFLHLSRFERSQVFLAAMLFIVGALGMEMVTASLFTTSDPSYKENFTYAVLAHIEELLEMLGVVVFIDFLLRRLSRSAVVAFVVRD